MSNYMAVSSPRPILLGSPTHQASDRSCDVAKALREAWSAVPASKLAAGAIFSHSLKVGIFEKFPAAAKKRRGPPQLAGGASRMVSFHCNAHRRSQELVIPRCCGSGAFISRKSLRGFLPPQAEGERPPGSEEMVPSPSIRYYCIEPQEYTRRKRESSLSYCLRRPWSERRALPRYRYRK